MQPLAWSRGMFVAKAHQKADCPLAAIINCYESIFFGATVELTDPGGAYEQRTARGGRDVRRVLLQDPRETVTLRVRRPVGRAKGHAAALLGVGMCGESCLGSVDEWW
eukprot:Skav212545  [mRNA]  locus=scaffold1851:605629:606170:+ [translate_table: standard]